MNLRSHGGSHTHLLYKLYFQKKKVDLPLRLMELKTVKKSDNMSLILRLKFLLKDE